jgi:hypothetical protein
MTRMDHSEKVRRLEESRQRGRLGGIIYPVANEQGCAMAPFQFAQPARLVAFERPGVDPWREVRERALNTPTKLNAQSSARHHAA